MSANTSATLAGLVTVAKRTYVACPSGLHATCEALLGHTRGRCDPSFPSLPNICICAPEFGLTPPGNCVEASCTAGPDACLTANYARALGLALAALCLCAVAFVAAYGCYVSHAARRAGACTKINISNSTLAWTMAASALHVLWPLTDLVASAAMDMRVEYLGRDLVVIPCFMAAHIVAIMVRGGS